MKEETSGRTSPSIVYVVMCYQSIVGIYVSQDDAVQVQRELIQKNRPADVLCRSIVYPNL